MKGSIAIAALLGVSPAVYGQQTDEANDRFDSVRGETGSERY